MSNVCKYRENDVDEIVPNLWLGNLQSSNDFDFLTRKNIKYIVRLIKEYQAPLPKNYTKTDYGYKYNISGITYFHFPVADSETCVKNLIQMFELINGMILNSYIEDVSILVHCKMGHHRSASAVAAFLIKYLGIDYASAVVFINSYRNCALRRETCMSNGLFRYYLNVKQLNDCDNYKCNKKNTYYLCECINN